MNKQIFLSVALALALLILLGFQMKKDDQKLEPGLLPNTEMLHIGIVVEDIEASLDKWVEVLGVDRPQLIKAEGDEKNPTQYRGHLSDAKAYLAFLQLENTQIELIEPYGEAESHWKEFLENHGESVHHIAFSVEGMGEVHIGNFEEKGYKLAQHGGWDTGEYGYLDGMDKLGVMIELLESYND